jgi:hypothetical protein
MEVCQRCPVLADCREWALSGRHLLGTIVGAICRGVCARQAIGARKHALVMRRRQDSNCGCALSGHVGRHSLDVTSQSLGYEQYDACFRHPGQSFADAVTQRAALPRICR